MILIKSVVICTFVFHFMDQLYNENPKNDETAIVDKIQIKTQSSKSSTLLKLILK